MIKTKSDKYWIFSSFVLWEMEKNSEEVEWKMDMDQVGRISLPGQLALVQISALKSALQSFLCSGFWLRLAVCHWHTLPWAGVCASWQCCWNGWWRVLQFELGDGVSSVENCGQTISQMRSNSYILMVGTNQMWNKKLQLQCQLFFWSI